MTVAEVPGSAAAPEAPSSEVPPPRGILHAPPDLGSFEHRRVLPGKDLVDVVAHFWWVRWHAHEPRSVETLPHPTTHLTFEGEPARAWVGGPASSRFTRVLEGRGEVLGVKFRPAMFAALVDTPAEQLADARVSLVALDAPGAEAWEKRIAAEAALDARIAICEAMLAPVVLQRRPSLLALRDLVEAVEHDRDILRVSHLVERAGMSQRSLERAFARYVGKSPKWVIRRYRLIDAAERLKTHALDLTSLAHDLGYFDQAHFVRDFRALVGVPPSTFRSQHEARPATG